MTEPDRPTLRIITADATPQEVAAILAVVLARAARAEPASSAHAPAQESPSLWNAGFAHRGRRAPHPSTGWRTSSWPR